MPLWGRGRKDVPDDVPDETFPFMSAQQVQWIRECARSAFAERGVEVIPHADHLVADNGQQFGLSNLVAMCHNAEGGQKDWPELVASHVSRILTATTEGVDVASMDPADVLSRTYLRLMDADAVPAETLEKWFSYARPVCSSLVELLALDFPETVLMLRDPDVELFGVEALRDAGLTNLMAVRPDSHEVLEGPSGVRVHVVSGESMFTASKLLVLRDVLRRTLGEPEPPDGVLVVAPFRHQIAFTPVEGPEVMRAVGLMAHLAGSGYAEGVGGLAPFVYWWKDGWLDQITTLSEDGKVVVEVTPDFQETLNRLLGE